jgi:hypothetical protein
VGLDVVSQQLDFSLGAFQSGALEREPEGAAEQIVGLLGADGLPYRRGGSTYRSNAALGAAGLLWVASMVLPAGERTLFASAAAVDVLAADDATPAAVPASPGGSPYTITAPSAPFRPVVVNGWVLLWGAGANSIHWWAGSRRATGTGYSTGSVTVTHGSKTVAGAGTSWLANLQSGDTFSAGGGTGAQSVVASVESNTSLTLVEPWLGATVAGTAYSAAGALVSIPTLLPAVYGSRIQASVANRWVVASGNTVYFTPVSEPPLYVVEFQDDDFHTFPGSVRGLGVLRDALLVFATTGVYAVSGMAYPLVDPGSGDPLQRKELVNADVIAWGHEGIAPWANALVVPALDGVYLMDAVGAPQRISDRIEDLYLSYVRAGYVPGVAEVYNGHYLLPVLNGATWIDTLVCRLQPAHSGNNFAWTQLAGSGAEVAAFAERQTVPPLLLAASRKTTSRVLDNSAFFKPAAAVKNDADGTAPSFQLTTIDYPTGNMVSNFVHHVRVMYELVDAASDNPTMAAEVSIDGAAFTSLTGAAPEGSSAEFKWRVNKHAKNVRFRFTVNPASASCKLKSVEVFVRHSGKQ